MLIPIKIGKKKYRIKPISNLTTREFIELSKLELPVYIETGLLTPDAIIKYIAWQLSLSEYKAFYVSTSKVLEISIGPVPDITSMKLPKGYDYKKIIDTVGQRHQVESSKLEGFDLAVFCLAVSQARSNNIDDVDKLYKSYLDLPFKKTVPAGFFFYKKYVTGKKSVRKSLKKLLSLMKIKKPKNKQA